jgi:hypothetical protein
VRTHLRAHHRAPTGHPLQSAEPGRPVRLRADDDIGRAQQPRHVHTSDRAEEPHPVGDTTTGRQREQPVAVGVRLPGRAASGEQQFCGGYPGEGTHRVLGATAQAEATQCDEPGALAATEGGACGAELVGVDGGGHDLQSIRFDTGGEQPPAVLDAGHQHPVDVAQHGPLHRPTPTAGFHCRAVHELGDRDAGCGRAGGEHCRPVADAGDDVMCHRRQGGHLAAVQSTNAYPAVLPCDAAGGG